MTVGSNSTRHCIALTILFCLTPIQCRAQSQESATKQPAAEQSGLDQAAIFQWFDGLGFDDFSKLPLVQVTTGWWSQSGNDEPRNQTIYAFLVDENKEGFRVYRLDLAESAFEFSPPDAAAQHVVKFERVSLAETVKRLLREHREGDSQNLMELQRRFGRQLSEGSEFIVLARACAAQNEPELAQELLVVANDLLRRGDKVPHGSLIEAFSEDLAHMTMWRIILDFGKVAVPRTELLARLEQFRKYFPTSKHYERASQTAEMLQQMTREDREHKTPIDFENLETKEKVAELIFRLRDQNGQQWSQPGSCDIFLGDQFSEIGQELGDNANAKPRTPSPAKQLVDIGFDAIPQLIVALEDDRLTRSVGYHRNFYFSHHVLRVGDCAEQIIGRIANRDFYQRTYTNAEMIKDGEQLTVKAQVEEWWREVKENGEKHVLVEGTSAGDRNAPAQAKRLIKKYSSDAIDALARGITNASSTWIRNQLIEVAGSLGAPASVLLKKEMTSAPSLETRVAAAIQLDKLDPDTVEEAMIAEWKTITYQEGKSKSNNGRLKEGIRELIDLLAVRDSIDAIQSLHKHLHVHPITSRFEVVTAFGWSSGNVGSTSINTDALNVPNDRTQKSKSVEKEIESILITSLSDTGRRQGLSGTWDRYSFADPRICDVAGYVLAGRFPEKYVFDPNAVGQDMEIQRIRAINVWRKENGLDSLPENPPKKIERLSAEITSAKLAAVFAAQDDQTRAVAINGVLQLGLGALPAVLEAVEASPKNGKLHSDLVAMSKKLACTVSRVTVAEESASVNLDLKEVLDDFEAKPLSKEKLVDLLMFIARDLPEGSTGINMNAHRTNASSGIELTVCLTTEWPAYNGTQQIWNINSSFTANGNQFTESTSNWSLDFAVKREAYSDFSKMVDRLLDSSIDKPFEIRFTMIRDE